MSTHSIAEPIEAHGCEIVLRRIEGRGAIELYFHCRPSDATVGAGQQAEAIYRAVADVLEAEGGGAGSIVFETVFLRELRANVESVRDARRRVLANATDGTHRPATIEIEQPPLDERAWLELQAQALVPKVASARFDTVQGSPACGCAECAGAHGLRFSAGDAVRFYAGGIAGPGNSAYEQALGMFAEMEALLRQAGMAFGDVVRTWIHFRDIDRDYADLNRARRVFFETRGIDPVPASTGIGGAPVSAAHDLCLSVYATRSARPPGRIVMTSPTLNEAMQYGADFVRGLRVDEWNRVALHVSGTASIDEHGRTAHPGDLAAQADRMLLNISALLQRQGAGYGDVVSAITYLKHPEDAPLLRQKLQEAGFTGFPVALVAAPICRADLLCETEVLAVLPQAGSDTPGGGV